MPIDCEILDGQMDLFDHDSWYGRTYQERSAQTKDKTSGPSLKKRQRSSKKMPLFLNLQTKNGGQAAASWEIGGALLGVYSMHSFGESPSVAVESRLSQILEDKPHPKYFLSAKACAGILRRAERRGKELPEQLKAVLIAQSHCGCGQDAPGGGKGPLVQVEKSGTLGCNNDQTVFVAGFKAGNGAKANGIGYEEEKAPTLSAVNSGTNQVPAVYDARGNGDGKTVCTITGDHENRITDYTALVMNMRGFGDYKESDVASCLKQRDYKDASDLVVSAVDCRNGKSDENISGTLQSDCSKNLNSNNVVMVAHTLRAKSNDPFRADMATYPVTNGHVRRLTPLECERLQGFPNGWTDIGDWTDSNGKTHKLSDSVRYKVLGNSIALPPWTFVLKRLCSHYERPATMASLFDGIGGFPLIWERMNGSGTCLWASEIEEFPMAVTKRRFADGR